MARKEKNIHYIYKTTCNVTGKYYIGMHSTDNLEDGYMGSGLRLRRSIRKYGVENHTKEILEYCETRELLVFRETDIVNKELISDGLCMNLKEGGTGGFSSEEHMMKCVKAGGVGLKLKRENDSLLDNKLRLIVGNSMKESHKNGKIKYNTFEGKNHSDETKTLIRETMKGKGSGETNSQYGTCWITKDGLNKKVKKEEITKWLDEGWIKGRK